ncbi:MAG: hypothetical protein UZ21_OP11001000214 [Microgenomates bacterium OLB22]|nr:MAG: hypothetical protein UZ21_OP11001000214 [Microgenomates bacterium OLB22]
MIVISVGVGITFNLASAEGSGGDPIRPNLERTFQVTGALSYGDIDIYKDQVITFFRGVPQLKAVGLYESLQTDFDTKYVHWLHDVGLPADPIVIHSESGVLYMLDQVQLYIESSQCFRSLFTRSGTNATKIDRFSNGWVVYDQGPASFVLADASCLEGIPQLWGYTFESGSLITSLAAQGTTLFVGRQDSLDLFDISQPPGLSALGSISHKGRAFDNVQIMEAIGNEAVWVVRNGTVYSLSTDPHFLHEPQPLDTPISGEIRDLRYIETGFVTVTTSEGVLVFDVRESTTNPRLVVHLEANGMVQARISSSLTRLVTRGETGVEIWKVDWLTREQIASRVFVPFVRHADLQ